MVIGGFISFAMISHKFIPFLAIFFFYHYHIRALMVKTKNTKEMFKGNWIILYLQVAQ